MKSILTEIQQSMNRINEYVDQIMNGFDKQKEEVLNNSEHISQMDEEFKEIVNAVQDNKEIVDELEKIIKQFKNIDFLIIKYSLLKFFYDTGHLMVLNPDKLNDQNSRYTNMSLYIKNLS